MHAFEDPIQATGTEKDIMTAFRLVRDEIKTWAGRTFG